MKSTNHYSTDFKFVGSRRRKAYIEFEKARAEAPKDFASATTDQKAKFVKAEALSGNKLDLSGRDLKGVDLTKVDLTKADLRGADLRNAKIRNANGANFSGASLSGASLRRANLTCAKFDGAVMGFADFEGAKMQHASKNGSISWFTNFNHVEAEGLQSRNTISVADNHYNANLTCATISGAQLASSFNDATAAEAKFAGNFSLTSMNRTNAKNAELQVRGKGMEMIGTELQGAKVGFAAAKSAEATGAHLDDAKIENAEVGTRVAAARMENLLADYQPRMPGGRVGWYEELKAFAGVDTTEKTETGIVPSQQVRRVGRALGLQLAL